MTFDISRAAQVPERASLDGVEAKLAASWDANAIYAFKPDTTRADVFSVDTPPPTVSGSLHIGSVFGYVQADAMARYQRMNGRNVFYPMGWDDNGLATERRVENYYGVRCDPTLQYDASLTPPAQPDPKAKVSISRRNFVELCKQLTAIDEVAFEEVWRRIGLSVDWSLTYATIGDVAQRVSQQAFLNNRERGEAYLAEAPTFWDVTFQTAVAQAEFEEREANGAGHQILFIRTDNNEPIEVFTTRPELLPAVNGMVINPEDPRVGELVGKKVRVPGFGQEVEIFAHQLAQLDKGTGIAMVSSFGDIADVTWWRELQLELRSIIGRDGRIKPEQPLGMSAQGIENYKAIVGLSTNQARKVVAEMLTAEQTMIGEAKPIKHTVKFYEKGDRPLEIVTSTQWYIRNGGRDEIRRTRLLELGKNLQWSPPVMARRYDDWVNGLNGDWLISRQRYFGVPFPIWYQTDSEGKVVRDQPLIPQTRQLPLDPSSDVPDGYTEAQRNQPNGFAGDPDIMDTWVTSSMTPQIAGRWEDPDAPGLFENIFPMDIRPQGSEIIRTWLFDSLLRSELEHGQLPWKNACINGWVLDPDRKKMSKSKGNVTTPLDLIDEHGADAMRYWACSARPGTDTAFDLNMFKNGRRLALKLMNAGKLVLSMGEATKLSDITQDLDVALLVRVRSLLDECDTAFAKFDYARVLERTEEFFWGFCDNQLELVKSRAYGNNGAAAAKSAQASLRYAFGAVVRLLAPIMPYACDEVWGWWQEGSVHVTAWPTRNELDEIASFSGSDGSRILDVAEIVLSQIRRAKTEAKVSMKADVAALTLNGPAADIALLRKAEIDLRQAGGLGEAGEVSYNESSTSATVEVVVKLA